MVSAFGYNATNRKIDNTTTAGFVAPHIYTICFRATFFVWPEPPQSSIITRLANLDGSCRFPMGRCPADVDSTNVAILDVNGFDSYIR